MLDVQLGIGEQAVLAIFGVYFAIIYLPIYVALFIGIVVVLAYFLYIYYRTTYWSHQGVPGPKPSIFFGNLKEYQEGRGQLDLKCKAKYGSTYGTYFMGTPDLASSDTEVLRHVLVKDFEHFQDRNMFIKVNKNDYSLLHNTLASLSTDDWKRIRNTVTPAFTTGKIKKVLFKEFFDKTQGRPMCFWGGLVPLFNHCAKDLCNYIDELIKNGQNIPLKDTMGRLTMSVIGRSAFAVDVDTFQKEEIPFIKYAKKAFQTNFISKTFVFIGLFPNLVNVFRTLTHYELTNNDVQQFFHNILSKMLDERRKDKDSAKKYQDFFQLLINVADDLNSEEGDGKEEDKDITHEEISKSKKKGISKIELLSQAFIVLNAGYETTAFTLQMVLYIITKMPEIQERMRDEIMEVIGDKNEIEYDDIQKLKYLNQVVQETLRMYPATARPTRICTSPITVKGIRFEKGITFSIPIFAVHYDENFYPNPHKFDPDRFAPEKKAKRDPLTYLPFGFGPRNCIGMRFASFEIWLTLAYLLKTFKFYEVPGSSDLPVKLDTLGLSKPLETLYVRAERIFYD